MNPLTDAAVDEIRDRYDEFEAAWDHEYCSPDGPVAAARAAEDVPALLAEIQRLKAQR
jgi:hypothetical protein